MYVAPRVMAGPTTWATTMGPMEDTEETVVDVGVVGTVEVVVVVETVVVVGAGIEPVGTLGTRQPACGRQDRVHSGQSLNYEPSGPPTNTHRTGIAYYIFNEHD